MHGSVDGAAGALIPATGAATAIGTAALDDVTLRLGDAPVSAATDGAVLATNPATDAAAATAAAAAALDDVTLSLGDAPVRDSEEGLLREDECVACLSARRTVAFQPCGHVALCAPCVSALQRSTRGFFLRCPMCRAEIEGVGPDPSASASPPPP